MKFDVRPDLTIDGSNNVEGGATVFYRQDDIEWSMRATDETFSEGGNMKGMVVGMKKADAFEFRYDLGEHAPMFRFHTGCRIKDRDLRLKFKHNVKGKHNTTMEASMDVNDDNRVTVAYDLTGYDKPDVKRTALRWRYTHDDLTVEPGYNFGTESLFAEVKYRLDDENRVRGHMCMHTNMATLEWINSSGMGGGGDMKVSARMCMDDGVKKMPTLRAEKLWTVDW